MRAWCRQQGITYQSFWTLTANPDCIKSGVVRAAAKKRGCEPEQVGVCWNTFTPRLECGIAVL
jgi:diketogulonate reductase-like aldo/keto reductase